MMTTFGDVFHDFAGSAIVHSVGGVLALIGAIALGPRIGKYDAEGKSRAIPGHKRRWVSSSSGWDGSASTLARSWQPPVR